jgi:Ataxin-3
LYSELNFFLL